MSAPAPVLLISADGGERESVAEMLERRGHTVTRLDQAAQVPRIIEERGETDFVILLDLARPEALRFLRARVVQPDIPVVCVADRRKPEASSEALRIGIADLVARPVREDDLAAAIGNAREYAQTATDARADPAPAIELPAGSVFGASPAIREVLALVRRIAPSRCNVLVLGERGTGRESVARAVHSQSPRRDQPFVKIDCGASAGAMPLFSDPPPSGSTVYLDDLNALPAAGQRDVFQLLRGGTESSELRFIAGVSPRVDDWVLRGELRADLVEALGVVRVALPPLRQRSEDIGLLATHFLKEACRRNQLPAKTFSRSALTLLTALPWPGNTSELRALAERLSVLVTRGVILLEDVLAHVSLEGAEALGGPSGTLREARERFERNYVASVLQHHRGRMGAAARELGIERTNLYRKIKQLNIRWTTSPD